MRNILLSLFFATVFTAPAQRFSYGVKTGVPLTSAFSEFSPYSMVDTGRWTIGPTAEVRLFGPLSLEVDALFRGYRTQSGMAFSETISEGPSSGTIFGPVFYASRENTKEWQIPLLLKYRFHAGPVRPFVDGGVEWTRASPDLTVYTTCLGAADVCAASPPYIATGLNKFQYVEHYRNALVGAGVEFKYGRLRISPEIRYGRRFTPRTNEATFLVGFTF